jgi:hypothetical protein
MKSTVQGKRAFEYDEARGMVAEVTVDEGVRCRSVSAGVRVLASCAAISLLSGCTGHLNRADGLLATTMASDLPDLAGPLPQSIPAPDEPSLTQGLDRSHWSRSTIRVERRQVESQPSYATLVRYGSQCTCTGCDGGAGSGTCGAGCGCGCNCGCGPAAGSLRVGRTSAGTAALEGVAAPFHAAFDLLAMPVRWFITPPWSTLRAPSDPPLLEDSGPRGAAAPSAAPSINAPEPAAAP